MKCTLIGHPLGHSLSPDIHKKLFELSGKGGEYDLTDIEKGDLENKIEAMAISEITASPLGFLLYFDPTEDWDYKGIDITSFAQVGYNEKRKATIPLILFEVNSWISGDFRTKDEITQCIADNREWKEENDNKATVD